MIDYEFDGPTYQAIADQIMDDVPSEVPESHLRISVFYEQETDILSYVIESHHEEEYGDRDWGSFERAEEINFSDDFEDVDDFLAGTLKGSTDDIPLMYNGMVIRNNGRGVDAFDDKFPVTDLGNNGLNAKI